MRGLLRHGLSLRENSRPNKSYLGSALLGDVGSVGTVTLTLTVNAAVWNRHVDSTAADTPGLVPVVKGNGYGFGRSWLANRAATLAPIAAVGSIFEVADIPSNYSAVVLSPALKFPFPLRDNVILTVGSLAHVHAAQRAHQPQISRQRHVIIKLRSSMYRYGVEPTQAKELIDACHQAGFSVDGLSIHPPIHGSSTEHRQEIENLLAAAEAHGVNSSLPVWVSHVDLDDYRLLRQEFADRSWHLRLGTSLWHGDKSMFTLQADVVDVVAVSAGATVGYRGSSVDRDGYLLMIGCGSAHGVTPLSDGRSPFHFRRRRLELIEAPHMHTSMCFVPHGDQCPQVGDLIDVQRPLTQTAVDDIHWV